MFYKRNKQPGCGCQESLEECGQDQIAVAISFTLTWNVSPSALHVLGLSHHISSLYLHFTDEETEPQHVKASGKVEGEHQSVRAESP